jgi:excisionase family DNA binding protein
METANGNSGGPRFVRLKAAAARFGYSLRTLYREIADGELRVVHFRGCACIEESEIQKYIDRHKGCKKP